MLRKRSGRSQYLSELLDYIESKMLLVQQEERDVAKTVSDHLKEMLEKCKEDERYAVRHGAKALRRGAKDSQQGKPATRSRSLEQKTGGYVTRSKRVKLSDFDPDHNDDEGPASRTRSRLRLSALQQTGDDRPGN